MRYKIYEINHPNKEESETLIILGNPATKTGQPSSILKSRLNTALDYIHQNNVQKIIVTGKATYNQFEEADVQKKYLIKNGIPEDLIIKENNSSSTPDNALYTYRLTKQFNLENIVIVTSHYHKDRTQYIFNHYFTSYKIVTPTPDILYIFKNFPYYIWDKYCLYRTKKEMIDFTENNLYILKSKRENTDVDIYVATQKKKQRTANIALAISGLNGFVSTKVQNSIFVQRISVNAKAPPIANMRSVGGLPPINRGKLWI